MSLWEIRELRWIAAYPGYERATYLSPRLIILFLVSLDSTWNNLKIKTKQKGITLKGAKKKKKNLNLKIPRQDTYKVQICVLTMNNSHWLRLAGRQISALSRFFFPMFPHLSYSWILITGVYISESTAHLIHTVLCQGQIPNKFDLEISLTSQFIGRAVILEKPCS